MPVLDVRTSDDFGISKIVFAEPSTQLGCKSQAFCLEPNSDSGCVILSENHLVTVNYKSIDNLIKALKKAKQIWGEDQ